MFRFGFVITLLLNMGAGFVVAEAKSQVELWDYIHPTLDVPLEILQERASTLNLDDLFVYGIALAVGRDGEEQVSNGFALIRHTETMTVMSKGGLSAGAGNVRGVNGQTQPQFYRGLNLPSRHESHNYNGNREGHKERRKALVCLGGLTHGDPKKREIKACGGQDSFDALNKLMPKRD